MENLVPNFQIQDGHLEYCMPGIVEVVAMPSHVVRILHGCIATGSEFRKVHGLGDQFRTSNSGVNLGQGEFNSCNPRKQASSKDSTDVVISSQVGLQVHPRR